jgi:hypothetical protein
MTDARRKKLVLMLAEQTSFEQPNEDFADAVLGSLSTKPVGQINALLPILFEMGDWEKMARVLHAVTLVIPDEMILNLEHSVVAIIKGLCGFGMLPQWASQAPTVKVFNDKVDAKEVIRVDHATHFILGAVLWLVYLGEITASGNLTFVREIQNALKDICADSAYSQQGNLIRARLDSSSGVAKRYATLLGPAMNAYVCALNKEDRLRSWLCEIANSILPVQGKMIYHPLGSLLVQRIAYSKVALMKEVLFLKAVASA